MTSCISIVFSVYNILTHMTTVLRVGSLLDKTNTVPIGVVCIDLCNSEGKDD